MEPRYCEDCRFCVATKDMRFAECSRATRANLVFRAPVENKYCDTERSVGDCGDDAKFFEAKEAVLA